MADPRVASIPVVDKGEPLIDVGTRGIAVRALPDATLNPGWRLLRAELVYRLVRAGDLLPLGLRLLHVEGYRPPRLQAEYFEEYRQQLATRRPELDPGVIHQLASRYVSPPEIAPHCAGAAVDLTLIDSEGHELDMGTPIDATPEDSDGGCYTQARNISAHARQNRDILTTALNTVGLVNYPTEWWHWSFGDRYWAMHTQQHVAIYAPVETPPETSPNNARTPAARAPSASPAPEPK